MTGIVRKAWGFNSLINDDGNEKNRNDLRHHAIDAVVVGLITPSLIKRLSDLAKKGDSDHARRSVIQLLSEIDPPQAIINDLKTHLARMVVSHKADHGTIDPKRGMTSGGLHRETAYGLEYDKDDGSLTGKVVHRIPLSALKAENIGRIRDDDLRSRIEQIYYEVDKALKTQEFKKPAEKERAYLEAFNAALADFQKNDPRYAGIRGVRIIEVLNTIPIANENGELVKSYKGDSNDHTIIWQLPDGKIKLEVISTFDAHKNASIGHKSSVRSQYATAKKLACLRKHDMVAYEEDGVTKYGRLAKATQAAISISPHNLAGTVGYALFSPKRIKEMSLRPILVDEIGYVHEKKRKMTG